jgi:hypothetical protein
MDTAKTDLELMGTGHNYATERIPRPWRSRPVRAAGVGEISLLRNGYKTSKRPRWDYWLYVIFNCRSTSEVIAIRDPARLGWQPAMPVEHYHPRAEGSTGAG